MDLSGGQQRKQLQNALLNAFPTKTSLEQMLSYELEKNLDEIAGGSSLQDIVFNLIKTANSQGWVKDLVSAAYKSNPRNQLLKTIAEGLLLNHEPETPSISSPYIPQKQSVQPQKILILAAIPHGLRLDKEIREIEEAIQRATNRDLFEIKVRTAVHPQDIRRALAEEQPYIVHFCGHGLEDGSLLLEDDGGFNKPVAPSSLASLFKLHADYVKCVLLNACYSEKPAVAISEYINYTIGMNNEIQDKAAIAFAKGFYDGLGYKTSGNQDVFHRAFDEAMVAIKMENLLQGAIPVLKKKIFRIENYVNVFYVERVDYTQLRDFLAAGKWREADYETYRVMLRAVRREKDNWLKDIEIESFPCPVLQEIDQLWAFYGNNRFGFRIQQRIWLSVGGELGIFNSSIFHKFGDYIGWRANNKWLEYDKFSFSLDAPEGHLPSLGYGLLKNQRSRWWGLWSSGFKCFCIRIPNCFSGLNN